MKSKKPEPETLGAAYMQFLAAPHPRQAGKTNADRGDSDRLNFQRALLCLAAGHAGDALALDEAPAAMLLDPVMTLVGKVELGAKLLNARKRRVEPSEKTIKNLVACCRAVRDVVYGDGRAARSLTPNQVLKARPKRRIRVRLAREDWPQPLAEEWRSYQAWKTKPVLAPSEGAHLRRRLCKPISIEAHAKRVSPLVRYLKDELGMSEVSLVDLVDVERFPAFADWYLAEDADGGYDSVQQTAITLATISKYLAASKRIEQAGGDGLEIWTSFYRLGAQVRLAAGEQGRAPERRVPDAWTPDDMLEVARRAFKEPAVRYWRGEGSKRQRQVFARKRYGLFYGLAVETPLRARNFQEMRWGHNLTRTRDGRWRVRFAGSELKVANRRDGINVYERTYSEEASALIDAWREVLRGYLGDDFERTHPYVFASEYKPDKPISHPAFLRGVEALGIECHGHSFKPHDARRVVATEAIKRYNLEGAYIAAELLGDTIAVVLKEYFRSNADAAIERYLKDLERAA